MKPSLLRTYSVSFEDERDLSEIHEWVGECQAKSGIRPVTVEEYDIRTEDGRLAPARFEVRILNWVGTITCGFITKGELYRLLHLYIRYVAVGTRRDEINKGRMKEVSR